MKGTLYGWGLLLALGLADYAEFSRALDEMYLQNPENARLNALESAQNEKDAILQMLSLREEADARTVAQMLFPRLEKTYRTAPLEQIVHYSNELQRLTPFDMRMTEPLVQFCYAAEDIEFVPESAVRENYEAAFAKAKELWG